MSLLLRLLLLSVRHVFAIDQYSHVVPLSRDYADAAYAASPSLFHIIFSMFCATVLPFTTHAALYLHAMLLPCYHATLLRR